MAEEPNESSGVRVVGAPEPEAPTEPPSTAPTHARLSGAARPSRLLLAIAVLGVGGTATFASLWATKGGGGTNDQTAAVLAAAKTFIHDLTNFDAKSIDADFNKLSNEATGAFYGQTQSIFAAYKAQLENDLVKSVGQTQFVAVQKINGNQASVYAQADQIFANDKSTSPASDELQLLISLTEVNGTWKISNAQVQNLASGAPTTTTTPGG